VKIGSKSRAASPLASLASAGIACVAERCLEVVGARKETPRVSPSRAPVLSCAHYFQAPDTHFQAPATQATAAKKVTRAQQSLQLRRLRIFLPVKTEKVRLHSSKSIESQSQVPFVRLCTLWHPLEVFYVS